MDRYPLTFDEACNFVGVSPPTLRNWIRTGRLVAARKDPTKKQSPYLITRQNCIAALNNPIHTIKVSAVDVKEGYKCQYSAETRLGTPISRSRVVRELNNLLAQRTGGRRRNCTTN
ncbi:helix-turn-helix domain-containing protein [Xenorhabdus hominickii]|uniref:helix-turn-helix domain-containing protein n=1 Tax=Xenorhabdus hominickii TaxID=351679 RepID=UPI00090407A9|nr:helix-turn-helix domain-containing protein [Xenorhabdus hominickii]